MVIIGLTGTLCSGKGEVAEFFKSKDFIHYSFSDILREEAKRRNMGLTRENLQFLGNELREKRGPGVLALLIKNKFENNKNYIIETIRNPGEIEELKKLKDFKLIAIDAPRELRVNWLLNRYNTSERKEDPITREEIIEKMDIDEGKDQPSHGQQVLECLKQADYHIFNDKDLNSLKLESEKILNKITNKSSRPDWNSYFMSIALESSKRSTCDRKHIGAVIERDKTILSTGYNGSIRGFPHCDDVGHMLEDGHCVATIHAEANAIIQAAKNGVKIEGATIYTTASPCWWCFKMIANVGIKKIVYGELYRDERIKEFSQKANIDLVPHY